MANGPSGRLEAQQAQEPRADVVAAVGAVEGLTVEVERGVTLLRENTVADPGLEPLGRDPVALGPSLRKDQVDDVARVLLSETNPLFLADDVVRGSGERADRSCRRRVPD